MAVFNSPSRAQFERYHTTGTTPVTGQPGSLAVNLTDNKLFTFDLNGLPRTVTQRIRAHDPLRAYEVDDIVVVDDSLWSADAPVAPGAFDPLQWTRLAGVNGATPAEPFSTGVLTGGVLSIAGANLVGVTAGSGRVIDNSNRAQITFTPAAWGAQNVEILPGASGVIRAVVVNANSQVTTLTPAAFNTDRTSYVLLGYVVRDSAGDIVQVVNAPAETGGAAQTLRDLRAALGGAFRVTGGVIAPHTGRQIALTEGTVFDPDFAYRLPGTPSFVTLPAQTPVEFDVVSLDGTIVAAGATDAPNTIYEAGALPPGFATTHFLFSTPDRSRVVLQLGQVIRPGVSQMLTNIVADYRAFDSPMKASTGFMFLGAVVIVRGATDLTDPAVGGVFATAPGPNPGTQFDLTNAQDEFLRTSGSNAMTGSLDMNGNAVQNAVIDEGTF